MQRFALVSTLVVFGSIQSACTSGMADDPPGDPMTATGGTSGGGPATGGGTSTGATPGLPGGPFPFPQNRASGPCTITTAASAAQAVRTAFDTWSNTFVAAQGAGLRVVRTSNQNDTVSEGIAYGMLIAVYLNERGLFDGLWTYAKSHFDQYGLMNWHITAEGQTASDGSGSAADADEDMAWALLMASAQWSSGTYLEEAKAVIAAMYRTTIAPDGMLKPGDSWGGTTRTFPDYFSPAYYRVFAQVTDNPTWAGPIIDRNYEILAAVSGEHGLVPDSTTGDLQNMGTYGYDACRTPWRMAMDYCFYGEPRAKAYLDKAGAFFDGQGVSNIGDGYSLDGTKTGTSQNMAFIGPAGTAGMAGFPTLLDQAFTYGSTGTGGNQAYYPQTLRVITMLMMSGNFLDFTQL